MSTKKVEVQLHINAMVKFKLNDIGLEALYQNYVQRWLFRTAPYPFTLPKEDSEGYVHWPLHQFMSEFGPHCKLGMQAPFDDLRVSFEY